MDGFFSFILVYHYLPEWSADELISNANIIPVICLSLSLPLSINSISN